MTRLFVGIPAYRRTVDVGHVSQILKLAPLVAAGKGELLFSYADSASLDWVRNTLLHGAIQREADWLLMCDADTYSDDADAIDRMLAAGAAGKAAVVGAPVKARRMPGYNVVVCDPEERNLDRRDFAGKVISVDAIGTAFMAINAKWIADHVAHPWFESVQVLHNGKPAWRAEDFLFCSKVKAVGGIILADGRFEPVHVGA